jgi:hypothetical protein
MTNLTTKDDFVKQLKSFTDTWPIRIRQSIGSNLDGFVSESGFMGEFLASLITGKKGTASAGSGFDLSNGIKADESKLAVLVRAAVCNKCGEKVLFFKEKCLCGSTNFTYPSDSRWGIDAKAGIEYKEQLDKYVLQVIKPINNSFDCTEFIYEAFLVDAKNKYFTEYLTNQYVNSNKSNNCNLLPYSYDFYRAEPIKVISIKITLNELNSNIECLYYKLDNTISEKMPLNIVPIKYLKSILELKLISYKNTYSKDKLIELLKLNINVNELYSNNFPLKLKNLNKDRGVTTRKI